MRASIVIAAHNEGQRLAQTVQSCIETAGSLDYEIVVADDASDDSSIEELAAKLPRVRLVSNAERQGASPTKALGAQHARGETLLFLDGHTKPEGGALLRLVEDVERTRGQAIITPRVLGLCEKTWRSLADQKGHGYGLDLETFACGWRSLSSLKKVREHGRDFYESPALIGCALAISRELYERLWGFDRHMFCWGVEDLDFGFKCWLLGHRILHDPEASIAHRFRKDFDNFTVPMEHVVANQLRMARKCFTQSVWADWLERCRLRNPGRLREHPEGLWARVWQLFGENRASVESERTYLQANRQRDEIWYASRFGLNWPRLDETARPLGAEPTIQEMVVAEPSEGPSGSPPPPARRLVLLFGYWPPTDTGNMLAEWKVKKAVTLEGKTYDVWAVSPVFTAAIGTYPPPTFDQDFWGKGDPGPEGITVDYRTTSTAFWKLVEDHRPIAIMSFSRWEFNKEWMLDPWATNWARDQDVPPVDPTTQMWQTEIEYRNLAGDPRTMTWLKPFVGGGATDPSPFNGDGSIKYRPPDRTQDALLRRNSTLPMDEIIAAIDGAFTDAEVQPKRNTVKGPGNFVSNFLAYHDAWYYDWWKDENDDPDLACLKAGHTHVGGTIAADDTVKAVNIQLKELFKVLPAT